MRAASGRRSVRLGGPEAVDAQRLGLLELLLDARRRPGPPVPRSDSNLHGPPIFDVTVYSHCLRDDQVYRLVRGARSATPPLRPKPPRDTEFEVRQREAADLTSL